MFIGVSAYCSVESFTSLKTIFIILKRKHTNSEIHYEY